MKTTPHRFLATGIAAKEVTINFFDELFPQLQVAYALVGDSEQVLGRTSYSGGWSPEVLAALANLQEKLEEFAINNFFDVPPPSSSTANNAVDKSVEPSSI
jgi:hypothetical protein